MFRKYTNFFMGQRPHHNRTRPQNHTPDTQTEEYYQVVFIRNTTLDSSENFDSGHVSTTLLSHDEISHMSFYPGLTSMIVNGITIGSIPAQAHLGNSLSDFAMDSQQADTILIKRITRAEYVAGKKTQELLQQETASGRNLYSAFGRHNPVARAWLHGMQAATLSNTVSRAEDNTDIPVLPEELPAVEPIRLHNCATLSTFAVNATRHAHEPEIPDIVMPTMVTDTLISQHGFRRIHRQALQDMLPTHLVQSSGIRLR